MSQSEIIINLLKLKTHLFTTISELHKQSSDYYEEFGINLNLSSLREQYFNTVLNLLHAYDRTDNLDNYKNEKVLLQKLGFHYQEFENATWMLTKEHIKAEIKYLMDLLDFYEDKEFDAVLGNRTIKELNFKVFEDPNEKRKEFIKKYRICYVLQKVDPILKSFIESPFTIDCGMSKKGYFDIVKKYLNFVGAITHYEFKENLLGLRPEDKKILLDNMNTLEDLMEEFTLQVTCNNGYKGTNIRESSLYQNNLTQFKKLVGI